MIDNDILREASLSRNARFLYVVLSSFANNETGECFPSRSELARLMGYSKAASVDPYLAELVDARLISVEHRVTDKGDPTSNLYTVKRSLAEVTAISPNGEGVVPVSGLGVVPVSGPPWSPPADHPGPRERTTVVPVSGHELDPLQLHPTNETQLSTNAARSNGSAKRETHEVEDLFGRFWSYYPNNYGKKQAKEKFETAIKTNDPEVIIESAKRYSNDPNREDAYTKHAKTWLENESWNDPDLPARNASFGKESPTERGMSYFSHSSSANQSLDELFGTGPKAIEHGEYIDAEFEVENHPE